MEEFTETPLSPVADTTPKPAQIDPLIRANSSLTILGNSPLGQFPQAFSANLLQTLSSWVNIGQATSLEQLIIIASHQIQSALTEEIISGAESQATLELRYRASRTSLSFPLEAGYSFEELSQIVPFALELTEVAGKTAQFKLYLHNTGYFYIVEHQDGKREVLRLFNTDRPDSQITADLATAPSALPAMRYHRFTDGMLGVLQEWVQGHQPETKEERTMCRSAAASLLTIPWEAEHPNTPYDFNPTNFLVSAGINPCAHYIDGDIIGILIRHGLSPYIPQQRRDLHSRGLDKLQS
jgi:hypothetical protein